MSCPRKCNQTKSPCHLQPQVVVVTDVLKIRANFVISATHGAFRDSLFANDAFVHEHVGHRDRGGVPEQWLGVVGAVKVSIRFIVIVAKRSVNFVFGVVGKLKNLLVRHCGVVQCSVGLFVRVRL